MPEIGTENRAICDQVYGGEKSLHIRNDVFLTTRITQWTIERVEACE